MTVPDPVSRERVAEFFRTRSSRPLSFRDVVYHMGLARPEARQLKRVLREMVRGGEVVLTRKGLYGPPEEMSLVSGYFESHREGFGFVVPDKPGERDFFVPPKAALGAMNNDRVMIRVENWKKREARVVRILERAVTKIVGTIDTQGPVFSITPRGRAVHQDFFVAPKDRGTARNKDLVIAEVLSYPTDHRPGTARVLKVLGEPEDLNAEMEAIIDEHDLPRKFPKKVSEEAKLLQARFQTGRGPGKRKDLRELPTVTIDGETARDFDDAVSVSLTGEGYKLWVHIADVGFFVAWDSEIDLEARKRGTSVYFPNRVIPMLPKVLSEDICSLNPGVDRFTFTAELDFDRSGKRTEAKFYPSVIRSRARMTYTSVRKILVDRDEEERSRHEDLLRDFELMGDLCNLLRAGRLERGSLDFDLPEPDVILDLQGNPENIIVAERNFAHMIIEEFMIAANEAVSEFLESREAPCVFRIHEEPDPMRREEVFRVIEHLGRFRKKNFSSSDFPEVIRMVRGQPEEELVNYVLLRSLKQAKYSTENVGHFGLASGSYLHFTSPIRRYPDLVVHRIIREVVSGKGFSDKRRNELNTLLPAISATSSQRERDADRAERDVIDAVRAWFMKDRVGEEFDAMVIGVTPHGIRVRLKSFFVDGFVGLSSLSDDYYQYDEKTMQLLGRHTKRAFRLGQELTLRVDRVNLREREVIFGL